MIFFYRVQSEEMEIKDNKGHDPNSGRAVVQANECVPLSDDDSVRATSAFSVRDSLKTDDEDTSQPISAVNAKLLRHEYNVMKNSNLVVENLEINMAQLMVANKKHDAQKMDSVTEEKVKSEGKAIESASSNEMKQEHKADTKQKLKSNIDTASQSLENPKSPSKSGSDVSSGLSKSVPPSYKQKILQFSRDKLRFGSGGNKLTRSIKRSFHFSRSWDKNKDSQRRTSEPAAGLHESGDNEEEKCSKEDKDQDVEKNEIIEEGSDDREMADNDNQLLDEEQQNGNKTSFILFV